jgi:hypothetical protein
LALAKWTTVQDNIQWWTLAFLCHGLLVRCWIEEFGAEADAQVDNDSDADDDWHTMCGKRRKKTIKYLRLQDNHVSLALLCVLTVPLDALVQYLSSQGLSDCTATPASTLTAPSSHLLRRLSSEGPVQCALREAAAALHNVSGSRLRLLLEALCSSRFCGGGRATPELWQTWGMLAVKLALYAGAGIFIKVFAPLNTYPYQMFKIVGAVDLGDQAAAFQHATSFFNQPKCCLDECSARIRRVLRSPRAMLSTDFLDFLRNMAHMIVLGNAQVERDHAHNMHVNAHSGGHRLGRRITLERLRCQSFLDSWRGEHKRRGGADPAVLSRATWAAYGVPTHRV